MTAVGLLTRRSQLDRVLDNVESVIAALNEHKPDRRVRGAAKPVKVGLIAAGGAAALTAASAGISSLRRRTEGGARDGRSADGQATRAGRRDRGS